MNVIVDLHIAGINSSGIAIRNGGSVSRIHFDECAKNYVAENDLEKSRCVATGDAMTLSFVFYTDTKTKLIFKKLFWRDLFLGRSAVGRLMDSQKRINQCGYTTYNLS